MRRRRRAFRTFAMVGSVLGFFTIVGIWIRSYAVADTVTWTTNENPRTSEWRYVKLVIARGGLAVHCRTMGIFSDFPELDDFHAWEDALLCRPGVHYERSAPVAYPIARDGPIAGHPFPHGRFYQVNGTLLGFQWASREDRRGKLATLRVRSLTLPIAVLAVPSLILPAVGALRAVACQLRSRDGLCRACGYDLRGTPDRCPECGTVAKA